VAPPAFLRRDCGTQGGLSRFRAAAAWSFFLFAIKNIRLPQLCSFLFFLRAEKGDGSNLTWRWGERRA